MSRRSLFSTSLLIALVLSLSFVWSGCENSADITAPGVEETQDQSTFSPVVQQFEAVMRLQERETSRFMKMPGVVGTATGLNDAGEPVIQILTERAMTMGRLPRQIDGVEVVEVVTGKIVAMKGKPGGGGGGVSHTAIQTPPISLGTSGGWEFDLANGYCCGGTLGSLISKGGKQYIMSNYHVLEADIVNGGNGRTASNGDPVIQPALIDINCDAGNAQTVATLQVMNALPNNNVDVAIAEVESGMVKSDGSILEIGTISSSTVAAFVGQDVKKSGRTTGLARSSVSGLNATVSITYENECAGGTAFTKTFTGQIVIKNKRSKFLAGGDSGSLMVEDVSNNPRAVGLLFAGSSRTAIANPIGDVLSFLNASMVGN
ncbi:hypothetical protein DRQ53_08120 [bacterium]|nr:MAG: hypothetical protein DRQ53_08120 [bacterium]